MIFIFHLATNKLIEPIKITLKNNNKIKINIILLILTKKIYNLITLIIFII